MHEIYKIYQCPRCKHMRWDAEPLKHLRRVGHCTEKGVEVREDFKHGITKSPPRCKDWEKGKPKNK